LKGFAMSSSPDLQQQQLDFLLANEKDLAKLGLLFLRMLSADLWVVSQHPSATLAAVMALNAEKSIGTAKDVFVLEQEMRRSGIPPLTDCFGGSVLRL
jgi:hypothetical protein